MCTKHSALKIYWEILSFALKIKEIEQKLAE